MEPSRYQIVELSEADGFTEEDRVTAFGDTGTILEVMEHHVLIEFDRGTVETISTKRVSHA